ncbi:hypothetical protein G7K_1402-t1 [Saitoella complicata NRRL Y-17804]|uniref:VWFA domain-containing protein n=1 Tax=Saitoella complicata (strain BCRC 22490 / CBS 7301 / JCM 7358 / NBRC 10748 / NRRL Y-17804) TaxID=698492 RepID=A0A0E9NBE1_SAICN|nr:hypothetical protein G7K_1402-t1 [Saitoella complicata NRRL Y-17804]
MEGTLEVNMATEVALLTVQSLRTTMYHSYWHEPCPAGHGVHHGPERFQCVSCSCWHEPGTCPHTGSRNLFTDVVGVAQGISTAAGLFANIGEGGGDRSLSHPQHYTPHPSHGGNSHPINFVTSVEGALERCIKDQHLEAFYPPHAYQQRIREVASRAAHRLPELIAKWKLPSEIAVDICKLALFDVILFIDDSGSMVFEEKGERLDDMKMILSHVAFAASLFDDDGIQVRFFNSDIKGDNIRSEADADKVISQVKFGGLTPIGTQLKAKILEPLVLSRARANQLHKPVLIITITDGQPQGEDSNTIFNVIRDANHFFQGNQYGVGALNLMFGQVGTDMKARQFLQELDEHHEVGARVDVTSNYEMEADQMRKESGCELSPEVWLVKLFLGAIDSSYDTSDEKR